MIRSPASREASAPRRARATVTRRSHCIARLVACASIFLMISPQVPAQSLRTRSDVHGALLVPLSALPASPEPGRLADDLCANYREPTERLSAAGRAVQALGWHVMSEAPLGRYRAVSFASGFDAGTSAICEPHHVNVGVFDGTQLIALAYTARSADWQLGALEPLETGGLLIGEGRAITGPVAELHEQDEGLRLTAVAASRSDCGGRAMVPNVFDRPIDEARATLIGAGWRPVRPSPPADDIATGLARRGVIEAESCAGTGLGYCAFRYRHAADTLSVVTVGGDPDPRHDTVVRTRVRCAGGGAGSGAHPAP